jgi:hypothetical protein
VGFPDRSRADFRNKKGPAGQIRKPASSSSVCLPPPPFELQYVEGCTAADGKIMPEGFIILSSAGKTSISFRFSGPITHPLILLFYLFILSAPRMQQRPSYLSLVYALNLISMIFLS